MLGFVQVCFQSVHVRNLFYFDWLVSRHPRKKGDILIRYIEGLFYFLFVIEALFILLHDHFISDLWLGVQSFISFISFTSEVCINWLFPRHVYMEFWFHALISADHLVLHCTPVPNAKGGLGSQSFLASVTKCLIFLLGAQLSDLARPITNIIITITISSNVIGA